MDSSEIFFNLVMLNGNNFSNLPSQYAFEYFSNIEYVNLGTTVANFSKISWNSFSSILAFEKNSFKISSRPTISFRDNAMSFPSWESS